MMHQLAPFKALWLPAISFLPGALYTAMMGDLNVRGFRLTLHESIG